jgi:hypothetical protein
MKYILEFFSFSKKNTKRRLRNKFDKVYKYYNSVKLKSSKGIHYFNLKLGLRIVLTLKFDSIHIDLVIEMENLKLLTLKRVRKDKELTGQYYINEVD